MVALVVALTPPLSSAARRLEVFQALQFSLLAIGVPALGALSSPWGKLGLANRLASSRRRRPSAASGVAYLLVYVAVAVAWRLPPAVNALAGHGWLVGIEAVTLAGTGMFLWLELVASPPLAPRLARPQRMALAAVPMWVIWVTAYLVGMSHAPAYRVFPHVPGGALSVSADQALATGVLWFSSLCAFLPVIFSNLTRWLSSDEDMDEDMSRLVRQQRRSAPLPQPRCMPPA